MPTRKNVILTRPDGVGPSYWPKEWGLEVGIERSVRTRLLVRTDPDDALTRRLFPSAEWAGNDRVSIWAATYLWCAITEDGWSRSIARDDSALLPDEEGAIEARLAKWWEDHDQDECQWQFRLLAVEVGQ